MPSHHSNGKRDEPTAIKWNVEAQCVSVFVAAEFKYSETDSVRVSFGRMTTDYFSAVRRSRCFRSRRAIKRGLIDTFSGTIDSERIHAARPLIVCFVHRIPSSAKTNTSMVMAHQTHWSFLISRANNNENKHYNHCDTIDNIDFWRIVRLFSRHCDNLLIREPNRNYW